MLLFGSVSGCNVPDDRAVNTLRGHGIKDVELGGHAWLMCGEESLTRKFTGTNVNGERVEGAVCCSLWKSCSVRF